VWLSLSECSAYIQYLKRQLDQQWLDNHFNFFEKYFKTPNNTKVFGPTSNFHPLAYLIYNAERKLEQIKKNNKIPLSENILKAANFGYTIYRLRNSNVKGLDSKINELMSSNHIQIEKTKYELEITRYFLNRGHKIQFVSVGKHKSQDLLVDEKVEVECKKMDIKSKERRIDEEYFKQIVKKLQKILSKIDIGYIITIKTKYLSQDRVNNFVNNLTKLLSDDKEGNFSIEEGEILLKKLLDKNRMFELNKKISDINEIGTQQIFYLQKDIIEKNVGVVFYHELIAENKHFIWHVTIHHAKDGTVKFRPFLFILNSPAFPTKYESIISLIKKAKKQFSKKNPSIIFVDMEYNPETVVYDFQRLTPLIEDIFRQNSSISAIVISTEIHQSRDGKVTYHFDGKTFVNKNARFPMSSNYEFFHSLESPIHKSRQRGQQTDSYNAQASTFEHICFNCRNKIFIQANFFKNLPILKDHHSFPKSNIIKCLVFNFCTKFRHLCY